MVVTCEAEECTRRSRVKGLCPRHYQQLRRHGCLRPETEHGQYKPTCSMKGCKGKTVARGYCRKHYMSQHYMAGASRAAERQAAG
jgi:hypothetical protein